MPSVHVMRGLERVVFCKLIIAEALLKLMDDVNLRREMGRRAYEDSLRYLPEVLMKRWMDLFEEMVRTK